MQTSSCKVSLLYGEYLDVASVYTLTDKLETFLFKCVWYIFSLYSLDDQVHNKSF